MQFVFGAGNITVTQLQTALGAAVLNPTPMPLMALQEGSVDFSGDLKTLYGQNQFAVAAGRGKVKLAIKVKPARIFAAVWNAIFFGQTLLPGLIGNFTDNVGYPVPSTLGVTAIAMTGGTGYVVGDVVTVAGGTLAPGGARATGVVTTVTAGNASAVQVTNPGNYSVAPTAAVGTNGLNVFSGATGVGVTGSLAVTTLANSVIASPPVNGTAALPAFNTYAQDLGCQYAANGTPLKRVATPTVAGTYSVNTTTGVYTFSAADAGNVILVNFGYSTGSAFVANSPSSQMVIQNLPMGYAPSFMVNMTVTYQGKLVTFNFPMCIASKMSMGFKNEDFAIPEFDMEAFDNGSGNVMFLSTSE
jgi:hypothetical protein